MRERNRLNSKFFRGEFYFAVLLGSILVLTLPIVADETTRTVSTDSQQEIDSLTNTKTAPPVLGQHESAFNRNVALYAKIVDAGEKELRTLLHESLEIEHGSIRYDTLFAISSRFALVNPPESFAVAIKLPAHEREPVIVGIFTEWSVSDLDSAIAAAKKLDRDTRLLALNTIAKVRDDLSELQLREIANELDHPDYVSISKSKATTIEPTDDPITNWRALAHDGVDNALQLDSFIQVAAAMVEQHGLGAIFHLRAPLVEDIRRFVWWPNRRHEIFGVVVDTLIKNNPERAWAYIEKGSATVPNALEDQSKPNTQSDFTRRERAYTTDVVRELLVESLATLYPAIVIDRIEHFPYHLQPLACKYALANLAQTDPERVVALIPSLKHFGASEYRSLRGVVSKWSEVDPSSALTWVMSSPEIKPESLENLMTPALYALVVEDPTQALTIAAQQPNSERLEAFVISELALTDLDKAIKLLPSVSPSAGGYQLLG